MNQSFEQENPKLPQLKKTREDASEGYVEVIQNEALTEAVITQVKKINSTWSKS